MYQSEWRMCYRCCGTGRGSSLQCSKCKGRGWRPWGLTPVTYGWGSFSVTRWEYGYVD